jgi:uncharacterized membrane protein YdjX (TVP38/TMEM64 family)
VTDVLAPIVLWIAQLGPWAPVLFVLIYIAAAVVVAPAFFLTVAAGAMFGVWRGSMLVFLAASLGASVVYGLASPLGRLRWIQAITSDPRAAAVRAALVGDGLWVMFLLRLSPIVPYTVLNYALAVSGVRFDHFVIALLGMLPAIVMYTYYGKVVGDVAALAAGVTPPRGTEYYATLIVGLVAVVVSTMLITRASRRALERQRHATNV